MIHLIILFKAEIISTMDVQEDRKFKILYKIKPSFGVVGRKQKFIFISCVSQLFSELCLHHTPRQYKVLRNTLKCLSSIEILGINLLYVSTDTRA
jgi:hypothetical protein